jgi:hypothetical protein
MKLAISPIIARRKLAKHVLSSMEAGDWNILLNGLLSKLQIALKMEGTTLDSIRARLEANNHESSFDSILQSLRQALLSVLHTTVHESVIMNYRVEKEEGTLGFGLTGVNTVTKSRSENSASEIGLTTFYLPGRHSHEAARELPGNWPTPDPETLEHMIYSQCFLRSVRNIHEMGPSRFASRADCCDLSRRIPLTTDCRIEAWMEARWNCKRLERHA